MKSNGHAPKLLLTREESAAALSIGVRTFDRIAAAGELTPVPVGSRGVRYAVADLEAWIERAKQKRAEIANA